MNQTLLNLQREVLRKHLAALDSIKVCCGSCIHFEGRRCAKFDAPPPAEWVKNPVECADWVYDEIPF